MWLRYATRVTVFVLLLPLGTACKSSAKKAQEYVLPAVQEQRASEQPMAEVSKAVDVVSGMDKDRAEKLVEQWLDAQNRLSFASYAKLYAQRFSGLKKVGVRARRMDRKGWLADRKFMFKKGLRVQAHDVNIALSGNTALVRFQQHWASASYEDSGPKIMTLVMEEGEARIAREEMLKSRVAGALNRAGEYPVSLVYQAGSSHYAIIGDGATSKDLSLIDVESGWNAIGPADLTEHPQMRAWEERQIRVFDALGHSCETVTRQVVALSRALPHFSTQGQWNKDGATRKERAQSIFEHSPAQFAVEIVLPKGDCEQIHLAQLITEEVPDIAVRFYDTELEEQAKRAFMKSAPARKTTSEYERERTPSDKKPWTEQDMVRESVGLFEFKKSKKRYVWFSLHTGDGCGGWEGSAAMLFEILSGDGPRFQAIDSRDGGGFLSGEVKMLLDSNHDGKLEFVHHSSMGSYLKLFENTSDEIKEVRFSDWDCGC